MLFEGQWRIKWDWYERVYDNKNKQSIIRQIKSKPEYYIEHYKGNYTSLLENKPLLKKIGRPPKKINFYSKISEAEVNIRDNYWHPDSEKTQYNINPKLWYIDIETTAYGRIDVENTPEEVVLIQIYDTELKSMIVLGSRPWSGENKYKKRLKNENIKVKYINCNNEIKLFNTFFKLLHNLKPLLVLGWNTMGFDYPYLYNRTKKLGIDTNNFSPFYNEGGITEYTKVPMNNGQIVYRFKSTGCYWMDYLEIYKKYTYGIKPSYSLDFITKEELGKGKINHDMYSTFDGMRTGDNYIFPENIPDDDYDKEMYYLQLQYKEHPTEELKEKIHDLANDLFVYYGIIDTFRVKELDDKLQLSKILLMISSKMGVTLQETLGTVRPWASYIEKYAFLSKQILPDNIVDENADTSIKGGYVAEPQKGKHRWVFSVDINSAYPNLSMRGFNMSPETYVAPKDLPEDIRNLNLKFFNDENEEERFDMYINRDVFNSYTELLKKYKYSAGINGAIFKQNKTGIIPGLVSKIYSERTIQKHKMLEFEQKAANLKSEGKNNEYELYMASQYNTSQMVSKVLINSLYGALGNKYFKLFNIHIARAITSNTRFYIHLLNYRINEYLQSIVKISNPYHVYNDTDSGYFTLEPIINKLQQQNKLPKDVQKVTDWVDKFIKNKINPIIEQTNKEFSDILNAYDSSPIKTEREVISDAAVFLSKKKYFMRVVDNEGVRYQILKLKVMGVEIARSSTPNFFKQKLRESIDIILDSDFEDLKEWILSVREEVLNVPLSEISKISGIGSLDYDLHTSVIKNGRKVAIPINSRAALASNEMILSNSEYSNRFNTINTGDKVKLLYMLEPNPFGQNVMAYIDPQFAEIFKKYIDYDKVFEKYFISALEIMIEPIQDWKHRIKHKADILDDW